MSAKRTAATTDAELAEYHFEHRQDESEWGPVEPIEVPARLDVTISVRFSGEELAAVRAAASAAGLKPTAFIRDAALAALSSGPPVSRRAAQRIAKALERNDSALREVRALLAP